MPVCRIDNPGNMQKSQCHYPPMASTAGASTGAPSQNTLLDIPWSSPISNNATTVPGRKGHDSRAQCADVVVDVLVGPDQCQDPLPHQGPKPAPGQPMHTGANWETATPVYATMIPPIEPPGCACSAGWILFGVSVRSCSTPDRVHWDMVATPQPP